MNSPIELTKSNPSKKYFTCMFSERPNDCQSQIVVHVLLSRFILYSRLIVTLDSEKSIEKSTWSFKLVPLGQFQQKKVMQFSVLMLYTFYDGEI